MAKFAPKIGSRQSELGLGKHVTTQGRLINPDGSFNVIRQRSGLFDNTYYYLVTISAGRFFGLIFLTFGFINAIFAALYLVTGKGQLTGMPTGNWPLAWMHAFFFSTQTITTVGYGHISPVGFMTNILASLESFLGLLFFALISGLLYGRFSRPAAKVKFSESMLVSPYQEMQALMFRIVNPRKSELVEAEVQVSLAINQRDDQTGEIARRFFPLDLEINKINFFPMSWTIVHAITEHSPLYGLNEELLIAANAEMLVLLKGTDEATEQLVHARRSYIATEVIWNAKFSPMTSRSADQTMMVIHSDKVGDYTKLG